MSLNKSEQRLFDYVQRHAEERHYWETKVREAAARLEPAEASVALDAELWRYLEERASVVREFGEYRGAKRVSLRNLAEHLLRLWVEPRVKKKSANPGPSGPV
jgi:hypothetical protein